MYFIDEFNILLQETLLISSVDNCSYSAMFIKKENKYKDQKNCIDLNFADVSFRANHIVT